MMIIVDGVLDIADVTELTELLADVDFEDGRRTAGQYARLVKRNVQTAPDPAIDMWRERIAARLMAHQVISVAAHPKRVIGPMFSRYRLDDDYGSHIDEPMMLDTRVDLSFTLFLSEPDAYDGGELVITSAAGDDAHKHAAGRLVLYPSSSLHRVMPVTRGERLAAVGWIRSHIRDADKRELLFDLETARRRIFETSGKTHDVDLLSKCHANLMRMWLDD